MAGDSFASNTSACGDWVVFKEEKCLKLYVDKDLQTYENAKQICASQEIGNPTLIMINSKDEQDFIENLLFNVNKVVEAVWLGARKDPKTKKFHWDDKTEPIFNFENWAELKNETEYECAEIIPDGKIKGKWINTSCKKKNFVLCQKMQDWTLARLQKEFLDYKKTFEIEVNKLKESETRTTELANKLQNNPVPLGFIYVQLPNQSEPAAIWPNVKWQDVSGQYANLFFRTQGPLTEVFGKVQNEGGPRLIEIKRDDAAKPAAQTGAIVPGVWTEGICTGGATGTCFNTRFMVLKEETRPKNMAIKLWRRI